jgi:CO/xanthine dehydrogenase Mo-binding subunit
MGPVIANAIDDAAAARMTQLPMTPVRIKAALARA